MGNSLIELTRGDDKVWVLSVTLNNKTKDPVDITGCTFKLTVRDNPPSAIVIQKTTVAGQIDLTDPTNGIAEITFAAADTSVLSNARHEYDFDVEVTKPTGKIETICKGKVRVLPSLAH